MAFLNEDELGDALVSAVENARQWFKPFAEYERIAANLVNPNLPSHYGQVTDGTLPALMAETPMRVWGQLQTGRVVAMPTDGADFEEWKTAIVDVYHANKIIPNANTQAPYFTKHRVALHKALTYGSQPAYAFPISTPHYSGSDFLLPQIRDVKLEPGKVSDRDSDYIWFDQHYTKLQLRSIIEAAEKADRHAGWNINELKKIYDSNAFTTRDTDDVPSTLAGKTDYSKTVTLSTCFHRGYEAPFYTVFRDKSDSSTSAIVRRQTNSNVTGDIPINFLYNQQDLVNPYGVSQVELAGPMQNLLDTFVAAHAYATQMALEPPIQVKGSLDDSDLDIDSLIYSPAQIWYTGDNEVVPVSMTTRAYDQFANTVSMYKTAVMNQQGTTDASTPGGSSGDARFSKTPAGVKMQQERTNAKDNFLRQNTDEFVAALSKNLINIAIQNTDGQDIIKISEEQKEKLLSAGVEIPENDMHIIAEFKELQRGEFEFEVDAGSSKLDDDDAAKERIKDTFDTIMQVPNIESYVQQDGNELHVGELIKGILSKSGFDGWEKVITPMSDEKKRQIELEQEQQAAATQQQIEAQSSQSDAQTAQEHEKLAQEQARTTAAQQKLQPDGEDADAAVVQALRQQGWSDDRIQEYLVREGMEVATQ